MVFFEEYELNTEQNKAMMAVISDTGRRFAPLMGLIISPIYVGLCFGVCVTIANILKTFKELDE